MNKLNQTEFSSIIGVSQGTLSELEKDKYYHP
ncbi:helix-turn-helix transcriptional regulator [Paenibacillus polymyxa]|nr:helix-turn-helix transcriptional regulator [Paenibacillus polymyxa]WRL61535.1 helix-turn-helix transcriptional regulator [Paenibacillus polymyxa]